MLCVLHEPFGMHEAMIDKQYSESQDCGIAQLDKVKFSGSGSGKGQWQAKGRCGRGLVVARELHRQAGEQRPT